MGKLIKWALESKKKIHIQGFGRDVRVFRVIRRGLSGKQWEDEYIKIR